MNFQKKKIIIRYQKITSFQRNFISFNSTIQSISKTIIQIKTDKIKIQLNYLPLKSIKLRQKITPIPHSSKITLQNFKNKKKIIINTYINLKFIIYKLK